MAAAALPVTGCAPLLDRSRVSRWGVRLRRTSYREPPTPPLFNAQCDGGPPAIDGLGAPDQGARSRPKWPLGHCGWEIKLTVASYIKMKFHFSYVVVASYSIAIGITLRYGFSAQF